MWILSGKNFLMRLLTVIPERYFHHLLLNIEILINFSNMLKHLLILTKCRPFGATILDSN
jgi:hypothetical protein